MASSSPSFADRLIEAVETAFRSAPKTGKPQSFEWTMVAAVVAEMREEDDGKPDAAAREPRLEVLTLGCGNKCIGRGSLRSGGVLVHDCHAEILAIRAFRRMLLASEDGGESFLKRVKALHLYISDSPCGEAQLYRDDADVSSSDDDDAKKEEGEQDKEDEEDGELVLVVDADAKEDAEPSEKDTDHGCAGQGEPPATTAASGFRRTGAKAAASSSASSSPSSSKGLRIKSGRSDLPPSKLTHSMSCSDKLCRAVALGAGGALLSALGLPPIRFDSITVSAEQTAWLQVVEALSSSAPSSSLSSSGAGTAGSRPPLAALSSLLQGPCFSLEARLTSLPEITAINSRWALKAEADQGAAPGDIPSRSSKALTLRGQLEALCRALVGRALPNLHAAFREFETRAEDDSAAFISTIPVLRVTSKVFSACRAATIVTNASAEGNSNVADDGDSTAAGSALPPPAKRAKKEESESTGAGPNKFLALSGGSGSKASVVPSGSALGAWREIVCKAEDGGRLLGSTFLSDGITASTGTPLGVAPKALEKSPLISAMAAATTGSQGGARLVSIPSSASSSSLDKPSVSGSRLSRFNLARLFLKAKHSREGCLRSADPLGAAVAAVSYTSYCKGVNGVPGKHSSYQRAWKAFLEAGDGSFAKGWVHLPRSLSSSAAAAASTADGGAGGGEVADFQVPLPACCCEVARAARAEAGSEKSEMEGGKKESEKRI